MDIRQLYQELSESCKNGVLRITDAIAGGGYSDLLYSLLQDKSTLEIKSCRIECSHNEVTISGYCEIIPYTSIGYSSIQIFSYIDGNEIFYNTMVNFAGEGMVSDFFKNLIPLEHVFKNFTISYPTLTLSKNKIESPYLISVNGTAKCSSDEEWIKYKPFLSEKMSFSGSILKYEELYINLDFTSDKIYSFHNYSLEITLAMRTIEDEYTCDRSIHAYLMLRMQAKNVDEDIVFQLPLFTDDNELCASAFFSPVLSVGKITEFIKTIFNINPDALLLPEDSFLSSFGLSALKLMLSNDKQDFIEISLKEVMAGFVLEKPWNIPIPKLTLESFSAMWGFSWWNGEDNALVTLDAEADASLALGKYTLYGRVKGIFPQMYFEGELSLKKDLNYEDELSLEEDLSFGQLASELNAPLPEKWGGGSHTLADFLVQFSEPDRSLRLMAQVEDILTVNIGDLALSIDSIMVSASLSPSDTQFGFSGVISFESENNKFRFQLSAEYNDGWYFSGNLAYGVVKIGELLSAMFGIESYDEKCVDIIIDDFSISYNTVGGMFELYASFDTVWFEIFGVRPELGGRIRLQKSDETELSASAALYLDIGIFRLLVQANDFYNEKDRTFLFRVGLWDFYVQGIYSKNKDGDELLTVSLSNQTLGEVVLALIHLINPNAKTQLSAPWSVLNDIRLSAFSLVINTTKNTADFLYRVGLSIPGVMEINEIGLRYNREDKSDKIKYIVTGRLLNTEYTSDDPLTWDAVDGAPPANTAAGEQKTKVKYIGIGAHLAVDIESGSISGIIEELENQLVPPKGGSEPEFHYSDSTEWIFGTDLTIADLFSLQLVLLDPTLYGGRITIRSDKPSMAQLDGLEVELMYQKISSSVGMLRCCFTPPKKFSRFTLGAVTISIGQITAEIYTNGSFLIDLGFPHNNDFSRSFGIEFGIYTGSGGIYFGVLKGDAAKGVPAVTNGAFSPVVLIGIGLKVGLGRSFDLGIVKGGVSLTVGGILEGVFALFNSADGSYQDEFYYRVSARAEIAGTLFLSADLCIISVSVSAAVSAACELTIESYRKSLVELELSLHLGASIRILFFKISFSFNFHQKVSFTFGADSNTPWVLADRSGNDEITMLSIDEMFPIKQIGDWKIEVHVTPLLSVKDPRAEDKEYCIAFLSVVQNEAFGTLADMLLQWLLADADGDSVTHAFAESIASNAANSISLDELESFFARNLHITVSPIVESDEDGVDGIVFPMLHKLSLQWNDTAVSFGDNMVTSEYFNEISTYFAKLNADPLHETSDMAGNDSMPFSGAIVLDYFRMVLSELIARLKRLFGGLEIETKDLNTAAQTYGVGVSDLLADNRDMQIHIKSLPFHTHTIGGGETLNDIAGAYGMAAEALWEDVRELPLIINSNASVRLDKYRFDNRQAKLMPEEAAALFFVRLYDPDVIYISYADKLVADNDLSADWECVTAYERTVTVDGHGSRPALAGDTVVRIAKAAAVSDGAYTGSDWMEFRQAFLEENRQQGTDIPESYIVSGESIMGTDNTPAAAARRLFPDFAAFDETNRLWNADFLCPLKQITLHNVSYDQSVVVSTVDVGELVAALESGTAMLDDVQTVKVAAPNMISCDEVIERILTDQSTAEIGAMISRFFMQGLRVPDPDSGNMAPLYELLRQQFDLTDTESDINITLAADETCEWITASAQTVTLTADMIKKELPTGNLPKMSETKKLDDFTQTGKYWGVSDKRNAKISDKMQELISLPKDLRRYIASCKTAPVLINGDKETNDISWCCAVEIRLIRQSRNLFTVIGAEADERRLLHELVDKPLERLKLLYKPSKINNSNIELTEPTFGRCIIIRSNLSLQTHMNGNEVSADAAQSFKHSADITDQNTFVRLLWECSTVGGGYLLYTDTDCMPDHIFDDNGVGDLTFLIMLSDCIGMNGAVNSAVVPLLGERAAFYGDEEKTCIPNAPVGCATLQTCVDPAETTLAELFHVMHYRAGIDGKTFESAPILPQSADDRSIYPVTVPLYGLCGSDNPYSAIGKDVDLTFYLNDVLGNTVELSTVKVTGTYNDLLISVNELPRTQIVYSFDNGSGAALKVSMRYCKDDNTPQEPSEAEKLHAYRAMLQAADDISMSVVGSIDNTPRISSELLSGYRSYVAGLYKFLSSADAAEPSDFSMSIPLDISLLPEEIFELTASVTVARSKCECDYEGVRSAVSALVPDFEPDFSEAFSETFPQLRLAYDSEHNIYAVPFGTLIRKIDISPYAYKTVFSPEVYALKPFSTSLITRQVTVTLDDGTQAERTYIDCDLQVWVKRFLNDMQNFTDSDTACRAATLCPQTLDAMIDTKKTIAHGMAHRVIPVSDGFEGVGADKIREEAEDLYLGSLDRVFDIDVLLAYRLDFSANGHFRMETVLEGAAQRGLNAQKLDTKSNVFCMYSTSTAKKLTETHGLSMSLLHLEKDISQEESGYEDSKWLRLAEPMESGMGVFNADLRADAGIPHPRSLCPLPPSIKSHSYEANDSRFLRWNYTVTVSCEAYEQYTVYLKLLLDEPVQEHNAGRDLFDILADYDCIREAVLAAFNGNDDEFVNAYDIVLPLAQEFSQTLDITDNVNMYESISGSYIIFKITFVIDEDKVNVMIYPDEESKAILSSLGVTVEPVAVISCGALGEQITFNVKLSGLPIYDYARVKPCAWIVQNENLFKDNAFPINEAFIFKTTETSLDFLNAHAKYISPFTKDAGSVLDAVQKLWDLLELSDRDLNVSVSAAYAYAVSGGVNPLRVSLPVTFIPDMTSVRTASDNIMSWISESGVADVHPMLIFDVCVYLPGSVNYLVNARIQSPLSSL